MIPVRAQQLAGFATVLGFSLASSAAAADWPTWRGNGSGVAEGEYVTEWSADSNVRWKTELPGPGNSSPIVAGSRVFVTQYDPESKARKLLCYATESGDLMWEASQLSKEEEPTHPTNPYCAASPVTNGEYVVAFFGSAGLCCYDMEGELKWRKELGSPQHLFGQGASPLIHGDMVTMNYGPGTEQFWVTLALRDGEEHWRLPIAKVDAPNPFDQPGGPKLPEGTKLRDPFGTWATPLVVPSDAGYDLVLAFPNELRAVKPESGSTTWSSESIGNQVMSSPMLVDGNVVCLGTTAVSVRPGGEGDVTDTHSIWFKETDRPRIGTGVATEDSIIANTMQGIVESIDIKTGERNWQERLASGSKSAGSWSSLSRAGDSIYAPSKSGTVHVFKAAPAFELIATNELGETMNSSLAFSDGAIYIRTDKHLWCIAQPQS
ncbi:MAG: PQQ-binding-like beta-propeller repeat protein [Planctomycetota bacterium]